MPSNIIQELLFYILLFLSQGFIVAQSTKLLDTMLDYGHPLDFIRLWRARRSAKKQLRLKTFNAQLEKYKKLENFNDRLNAVDSLYSSLIVNDKSFLLWLCTKCMAIRLNAIVVLIGFLICYSYETYSFAVAASYALMTNSFTYYFITRK